MEALRVALIFALVAVVFTAEIKEEKKKEIAPSDVKESKKGEHQEVNSVVEEEGKSEVKTEEKKTGTEVKTEVKKKEEGEKKKQVHESSVEEEEENDDINVSIKLFVFTVVLYWDFAIIRNRKTSIPRNNNQDVLKLLWIQKLELAVIVETTDYEYKNI